MNVETIRKEYHEHKSKYRYMIYTDYKDGTPFFHIKDVNPERLIWGEFLCNYDLYKKSLEDCIKSVNGTRRPIIYNGENVNPVKESIFVSYNPYTGEFYRDIYY